MAKILVILTGCPGSGKTCFSARLCSRYPELQLVSYDAIKEEYFDEYGFDNAEEKRKLNERSLLEFYRRLGETMKTGESILIEYPFCQKHRAALQALAEKYFYHPVTILLAGDMQTLFQRGRQRDRSTGRHPGHLLNAYHKGITPVEEQIEPMLRYEEFVDACRKKDYNIRLGTTLQVDVTDLQGLDMATVFNVLDPLLRDGEA